MVPGSLTPFNCFRYLDRAIRSTRTPIERVASRRRVVDTGIVRKFANLVKQAQQDLHFIAGFPGAVALRRMQAPRLTYAAKMSVGSRCDETTAREPDRVPDSRKYADLPHW